MSLTESYTYLLHTQCVQQLYRQLLAWGSRRQWRDSH